MQQINRATMQMLDFQKGVLNSLFDATYKIQLQTEAMTNDVIERYASFAPAGTTAALKGYMEMCKLGRENVKQLMDLNFNNLRSYFEN